MDPSLLNPDKDTVFQRSRRPSWLQMLLIIAGFVALVALIGGIVFMRMSGNKQGNFNMVPSVTTAPVRVTDLPVTYQTVGTLEANRQVTMNPEVAGRVTDIFFAEGQWVQKGAPLLRLRADKQVAQLSERRYSVDQAQASYESLNADYQARQEALNQALSQKRLSEAEYNRYKALREQDFISAQELDQRKTNLEVAEANVQMAERQKNSAYARLKQGQAGIESARSQFMVSQVDVADTIVRAPFSGQMGAKKLEIGDYVIPGEGILTLVETNPLKVQFGVPERYLNLIREGQEVQLVAENTQNQPIRGRLYFVSPVVDMSTRTVLVKAQIENPNGQLRPGQYATLKLVMGHKPNTIMIPEEALIPQGERYMVYTVEGGTSHFQPVEVGNRLPGWVEITRGLTPTSRVITGGIQKVQDGIPVKELNAKPQPAASAAPVVMDEEKAGH